MVENQNSILHCSHHRQMVDQLHGGRSVPSTACPRWLPRDGGYQEMTDEPAGFLFFPGSFDLKIRSFVDGWIFSLGG